MEIVISGYDVPAFVMSFVGNFVADVMNNPPESPKETLFSETASIELAPSLTGMRTSFAPNRSKVEETMREFQSRLLVQSQTDKEGFIRVPGDEPNFYGEGLPRHWALDVDHFFDIERVSDEGLKIASFRGAYISILPGGGSQE